MKFSYRWLQSYFAKPLPQPEELIRLITFHLAEVEGLEVQEKDVLLEVKILPDRTHDCLGHRGLAREIGALINEPLLLPEPSVIRESSEIEVVPLKIKDFEGCFRAVSQVVTNVRVAPSPAWLLERLQSLGQRSINNIVDATNFLMFDLGQPVHAFDLGKIKGQVVIRRAKNGEQLVTLDNRSLLLDDSMLVIADDDGPLDLAGIKGGKRSGISEYTQKILLTACNFAPTIIRETTKRIGLMTDAGKRFAQGLSPVLASQALDELILLILSFGNEDVIGLGHRSDEYPNPIKPVSIPLVARDVNGRLGTNLSPEEIKKIFNRLNFKFDSGEGGLVVSPPLERLDLKLKEDLIEEVARVYGYHRLPSKLPPGSLKPAVTNINFDLTFGLKSWLALQGFTENYGYTFSASGEVALENPLSADRSYLRSSLTYDFLDRLKLNLKHTLFETEIVRMFEFGNVFSSRDEATHLAFGFGYRTAKQKTKEWETVLKDLWGVLGIDPQPYELNEKDNLVVIELNWSEIFLLLKNTNLTFDEKLLKTKARFQPFSFYPRIIRDVALFVPTEAMSDVVADKIKKLVEETAGELLTTGPVLFDTFEKGDKKSLAFRLVFQALDRTLTDDEVNEIMTKTTTTLAKNKDWQLRS